MTLPNRLTLIIAKMFLCAAVLCGCLATAVFIVAHVQASGFTTAQSNELPSSATERPEVLPASQNRGEEEDEAPASDPPGGTDQNNSTGDDVIVRIPR